MNPKPTSAPLFYAVALHLLKIILNPDSKENLENIKLCYQKGHMVTKPKRIIFTVAIIECSKGRLSTKGD